MQTSREADQPDSDGSDLMVYIGGGTRGGEFVRSRAD
jgi:hypothetical protein